MDSPQGLVCEEYILVDDTLDMCYEKLPCSRRHASVLEIDAWRARLEMHIAELEAEYQRLKESESD